MRVCAFPSVSIRAGFCADSRVYYIPLRGKKQGEPLGGQQKKLRHAVKRQRGAVCNFFLQGLFCQLGTHAGQGRFDHAVHIVVLVLTQAAAEKDLALGIGQGLVLLVLGAVLGIVDGIVRLIAGFPLGRVLAADDRLGARLGGAKDKVLVLNDAGVGGFGVGIFSFEDLTK